MLHLLLILSAFSLGDLVWLCNFTCYPYTTETQLYFSASDWSPSNSIFLCLSLTIASGYHAISLNLIVCLSFSIFSLCVIVDNDNIDTIVVTYNLRQVVFLDCFLLCCNRQVLYRNNYN